MMMRLFVLLSLLTLMTIPANAKADLKSVCKNIRNLKQGEIYKSKASDHISDQRSRSTSFITKKGVKAPKNSCLYVYDRKGNLIHKLGRWTPSGSLYSSRYYGGHGCGDGKSASSVAQQALAKTGSAEVYITSGTGNCARIPNAGKCYNSDSC